MKLTTSELKRGGTQCPPNPNKTLLRELQTYRPSGGMASSELEIYSIKKVLGNFFIRVKVKNL